MQSKLLSLSLLIVLGVIVLSFSKWNTGIKRRVSVLIPNKIVEIIKETNFESEVPHYLTNDSLHYSNQKLSLKAKKVVLKKQYLKAKSQVEKTKILDEASNVLYSSLIDSLIPYWYGTPWDYNGITQKPGKGQIACGYFVFTLLRDAGLKLPRIKMSQAASEQALTSLVSSDKIKRYSNLSLKEFNTQMKARGNGIYIIGLDNHIGLYQVKDKEAWFIHSTVIYPSCVIKEKASVSPALEYSSYRVAGKLSDYSSLTKKWLFNQYIALK